MNIRLLYLLSLIAVVGLSACDDDDQGPSIEEPATYEFTRDGQSTVSFTGQTTRILMAEELVGSLKDWSVSVDQLNAMYANPDGVDPFANPDLNAATKSIRSKVAASADYFSANTARSATIKAQFEDWMEAQVTEIAPAAQQLAEPGQAGQIADGTAVRYLNAQGVEFDQFVNKGLMGALMLDQMLNNYLSTSVLDAGNNREENDNGTTAAGENYTTMEHKWDEAYGYLYGTAPNPADPNTTIGQDDSFLNKYVGRMDGDPDFMGYSDRLYAAFKLGRAAIVAGDYDLRDQQADIIREELSEMIGIRAVFYLQTAKQLLETEPIAYGTLLHDLSEAYGFIYSLEFTRKPGTDAPYFTGAEVEAMLEDLLDDGLNGMWDVSTTTLQNLSETIAAPFKFTIDQAMN